jgi:hypothetical protein
MVCRLGWHAALIAGVNVSKAFEESELGLTGVRDAKRWTHSRLGSAILIYRG